MKSILLILVFFLSTLCVFSGEAKKPVFFSGVVNGENVSFMIQSEGSLPNFRKLKGSTLINVEPGCIMVETYCKYLDKEKLQIELPHDGYFSRETKKILGVKGNIFVVKFESDKASKRVGKILSVTPAKGIKSERKFPGKSDGVE